MVGYRAFGLLILSAIFVACSSEIPGLDSQVNSHSTQSWSYTAGTQPMSMVAESGNCANNLSDSSFVSGYCFNEIPAVVLNLTMGQDNKMVGFCLATHLPGMSNSAALLVVDAAGNSVSELIGNGTLQMIDGISRTGRYKFYVGFPTSASGQKVTLRIAALSQFSLSAPACNLR